MRPYHNSRELYYRNPVGAVPAGTRVRLRLRVDSDSQPESVIIRTWTDRESWTPMTQIAPDGHESDAYHYEYEMQTPATPGLVWYDFRIRNGSEEIAYGNAPDKLGGEGCVWGELPPSFQLTTYDPVFMPPRWMRDAVVYQILPDRFNKVNPLKEIPDGRLMHSKWSDAPGMGMDPEGGTYRAQDFYGGTLEGVKTKLPELAKLGVTCLYLNPIFEAPSNHRYDTTDYMKIDPMLGTERDFSALCQAAGKLGIRIMLDGVFSHMGSESPYFKDALTNPESDYRKWFQFTHWPDKYECWWGVPSLPNVNETELSYKRFILGEDGSNDAVVPHWLNAGASGWRLDVADELPMEFLRELRSVVKRANPEACVLGEVWENASCKIAYDELRSYVTGDTLDSVMNYPLRAALISFLTGATNAQHTSREINAMMEQYPKPFAYALMNILGSHDRARILNALAGMTGESMPRAEQGSLKLTAAQRELAKSRLRLMFGFIAAWPGMPTIYYGDEVGMEGAADPYCRASYPWTAEDADTRKQFARVLRCRNDNQVLRTGEVILTAPDDDVLLIIRQINDSMDALGEPANNSHALFIMNRADEPRTIQLPVELLGGCTFKRLCGLSRRLSPRDGQYTLKIKPLDCQLWVAASC